MKKNNGISRSKGATSFIDLWAIVYLALVYSLTLLFEQSNIIVFALYFVFAMPFFAYLDKFVCVCFVLSTMSYYFLGADEGIWSIYTILVIMILLQLIINKKETINLKSCLTLFWLIAAIIMSYSRSEWGYSMGMFAMIYNIAITVFVITTVKIKKDTIVSFLPKITAFQLLSYVGMLLINGHYDGYGFSVSKEINHNTFGTSVAILSVIILVKIIFFKRNSFAYTLIWLLSIALIVLSGSRNALLATILSSLAIYMVSQKHRGRVISGWMKFLTALFAIVFLLGLVLPEFGIDLSRYNYVELFTTGGSNRTIIWETLSPLIWNNYKWFGYGPGHFCSEKMIISIMNLEYKHTHNTIFEAWGELGIFGLIPFLLILFFALKKGRLHIKNESAYALFGFVLFEFLLLGLGESFFANIELWLIIGLLLGGKKTFHENEKTEINDDEE